MDVKPNLHSIYEFGNFRLDPSQLMVFAQKEELKLPPKAVETLLALVERNGRIVSKDELMEAVWSDGTIVEESNLSRYIHLLRSTLGHRHNRDPYIETFRRRGYRFTADVRIVDLHEQRVVVENRVKGVAAAAVVAEGSTGKLVSIRDWQLEHGIPVISTSLDNLPSQLTTFFGREAELSEIREMLGTATVRLVTILGAGGSGKTRLAIEIASELKRDFRDGTFLVRLSPITDPNLIVPTIISTLRVEHSGDDDPIERLVSHLRDRSTLLILDNFEHVSSASPAIAEVLESCPFVKIVVTSRSPLMIRGEHEFCLSPLPVVPLDDSFETVAQLASVQLFVDRAKMAARSFYFGPDNAEPISQICHRLDGLPLAIEIAAVRARSLSVEDILSAIKTGVQMDAEGYRDLPSRQRTMRSAIQWSFDLLGPEEQQLFVKIGVFEGGFTPDAAGAMSGFEAGSEVSKLLETLVEKSLLVRATFLDKRDRFTFLEPIREFATGILDQSPFENVVRQRHADFFLAFAKTMEKGLAGSDQPLALAQLEVESSNLRAALAWYRKVGRTDLELKLASYLGPCWLLKGHFAEGKDRFEDIFSRADASSTPERARALVAFGQLIWMKGDLPRAIKLCKEALSIANLLKFETVAVKSLFYLGLSYLYLDGDEGRARVHLEECLARARESDFEMGCVFALVGLAEVAKRKSLTDADQLLKEAVTLARVGRAHTSLSLALANSARIALQLDRLEDAEQCAKESLRLRAEIEDWCGLILCTEPLAGICIARGNSAKATMMLAAMDPIIERAGAASPGLLRPDHESNVAKAKAELGRSRFDELWELGRRLSPDQVVQLALSESTRFPSSVFELDPSLSAKGELKR